MVFAICAAGQTEYWRPEVEAGITVEEKEQSELVGEGRKEASKRERERA